VRCPRFALVLSLGFALLVEAGAAEVIKVLPQFLDLKGRASLNPSLYERDAYQAELRADPKKRSGLRFNVQWKARGYDALILRLEAKGMHASGPQIATAEQSVKPGFLSRWTPLTLDGEEFKRFGELVAWRAILLNGTNVVAEEKSFLW